MLAIYLISDLAIVFYKKSQNRSETLVALVKPTEYFTHISKFILGIVLIFFGADLLVTYGVTIAEHWGIPSAIISLTVIALGTSLPELVTAVTALLKGRSGLSIGNILGANILNFTMVLGLTSQFHPLVISKHTLFLDIPVALALNMLLILPTLYTKKITRLQSILLLTGYFSYIAVILFIY
jgi:cation:H+ antiporter